MKRSRIIVLMLVVFASGLMLGGLGALWVLRTRVRKFTQAPAAQRRELVVRQLDRRLGLDAAQRARLEEISLRMQGEFQAVRDTTEPEMRRILEGGRTEFEQVLREDQRERLRAALKRFGVRIEPTL